MSGLSATKKRICFRNGEMEGISTEEKQEFMLEIYWATLYKLDEKEMR